MKKNNNFFLKTKIANSFMFSGRKETCEKNLIKTLKNVQRNSTKNCKNVLKLFILNLTPIFKLNKQSKKRGKKKKITYTPYLIPNNELRINFALKLLKSILLKNQKKNIINNLSHEIINSITSLNKSVSIEKKNEIQKQVLSQKRYFYKFRW